MPQWMQISIGIGALIGALGIFWSKVLKPGATLITKMEVLIPLMLRLEKEFADVPNAFAMLRTIYDEFKTNSGSSLRDAINRLEGAAETNSRLVQLQAIQLESAKQLAERDRQQMQRLELMMDRMTVKTQEHREKIAGELAESQRAVKGVAYDLAKSHERADAVSQGPPDGSAGEAADAAAQSSKTDEAALDSRS